MVVCLVFRRKQQAAESAEWKLLRNCSQRTEAVVKMVRTEMRFNKRDSEQSPGEMKTSTGNSAAPAFTLSSRRQLPETS
jgi:hypothetical protein